MSADAVKRPAREREPMRALLAAAIDYAGLFPPAALSMAEAVHNYAAYRASADRWALGRFVVPLTRLPEFLAAQAGVNVNPSDPWQLSVICAGDPAADADAIVAFNDATASARVAGIEEVVRTPEDVAGRGALVGTDCYCEVALDAANLESLLLSVREAAAYAKVRTGGLAPEAIPSAAALAEFIARCAALSLPFKATAGLHHPFRGVHALTADPAGPRARMLGFVPLALAAALLAAPTPGAAPTNVQRLLEADGCDGFTASEVGLNWLGQQWNTTRIAAGRVLFHGFGSCSFVEPLADLRTLGLLGPPAIPA